jgi:hypothetical protein
MAVREICGSEKASLATSLRCDATTAHVAAVGMGDFRSARARVRGGGRGKVSLTADFLRYLGAGADVGNANHREPRGEGGRENPRDPR